MNTLERIIVVLALVGIPAYGATMNGTVRTADGDPIAATVTVLYSSQGVSVDVHPTDENGTVSIEIGSGAVAVAAKAANYSSHEIDLSDGVPSSVRFTLRPLLFYRGTVTDSSGKAVSGASARVREVDIERSIVIDSHSSDTTDSNGEFAVAVPLGGPGRFVVDVEAEGWVPQSSSVLSRGSVGDTGAADDGPSESVRVLLEDRGADVRGTVTTPNGSTLSGITVLVSVVVRRATVNEGAGLGGISGPGTGTIRPYGSTFKARTVTDGRGRYEVRGLPPGNLGVVAIKRGVVMQPRRFQSREGAALTANFVVPE